MEKQSLFTLTVKIYTYQEIHHTFSISIISWLLLLRHWKELKGTKDGHFQSSIRLQESTTLSECYLSFSPYGNLNPAACTPEYLYDTLKFVCRMNSIWVHGIYMELCNCRMPWLKALSRSQGFREDVFWTGLMNEGNFQVQKIQLNSLQLWGKLGKNR